MVIHFSSSFGYNNVYTTLPEKGQSVVGEVYLGKKGLLDYLENHLGLYQKENHNAVRIATYEQAINKSLVEHPNLYIQKSFEVDSWGVAQKLLAWQDELVLAGFELEAEHMCYDLKNTIDFIKNIAKGISSLFIKKCYFPKCNYG